MSRRLAAAVLLLIAFGPAGPVSAAAPAGPDALAPHAPAADALAPDVLIARVEADLRRDLGARFGGAWIDRSGQPVVAVTDPAALGIARATGAQARLVVHAEATLTATAARLDRAVRHVPDQVTGWYVDLVGNRVVLHTVPGGMAAARAFITAAGAAPGIVRVVTAADRPTTLATVRGGDPFFTASGGRCTVGFTVVGGFLTAGHCGRVGDNAYAGDGQVMGVFQASSFPGGDWAFVRLNRGWTPVGEIRGAGGNVPVRGSVSAPVGATVCRYGSTTGWRCGTILAKNQTVNYASGVVYGLTRTNVCAEPGDSGGPFISGNQAQGITSGGSGNCRTGGTTFFQPVNPPLLTLGLTLLTVPAAP